MGSAPEGDLPSGEVTFLFTDIEGSTRLYQRLGDVFEVVLDRHRALCRAAFSAHGGSEVACPGDGFTVAFPSAAGAVAAAVDAQRALAAETWPEAVALKVRMGVHTGPARLTTTGGTYMGMTVHEAARIADAAHGGQVLLSEECLRALGTQGLPSTVEAVSLGAHRLRDLQGARRLFELRGPGLPAGFPSLRTGSSSADLPVSDPLLGREGDLSACLAALARSRLVTIVGPGGVGKTSLALAVAHRAQGEGVDTWFVDLAPAPVGTDPDHLATVVGAAFGLEVDGGLAALAGSLADRRGHLLLDNCEHVLPGTATVARALMDGAPSIRVLATSRERLDVAREAVVPLAPLDPTAARQLFLERGRTAAPSVEITDELLPVVDRICDRLDGMPLAIELAARRLAVLGVVEIDTRLEHRFGLLRAGSRGAPTRQQTLEAAVDWSYSLLQPDAQRLLRRLAVFAGGWDLPLAEQVCGGPPLSPDDVLDLLTRLVDQSLVIVTHDDGAARYSMLETIRAFAADRLASSGERDAVRDAHLRHLADRSWELMDALGTGQGLARVRTMTADADNLRAAVAWARDAGDVDDGLRAASGAAIHGMEGGGGYYAASASWIDRLLEAGGGADDPRLHAQALLSRSNIAFAQSDLARAARCGEEALALVDHHDLDGSLRAQGLAMIGLHALGRDPRQAMALERDAADCATAAGWDGLRVYVLGFLSTAALLADDLEEARVAAEIGLAEARGLGLGVGIARSLNCLADVALRDADVDLAHQLAEEAIATAESAGAGAEVAASFSRLATAAFLRGDDEAAARYVTESADRYVRLGQPFGALRMWVGASRLTLLTGRLDLARLALERVVAGVQALELGPAQWLEVASVAAQARGAGLTKEADALEEERRRGSAAAGTR